MGRKSFRNAGWGRRAARVLVGACLVLCVVPCAAVAQRPDVPPLPPPPLGDAPRAQVIAAYERADYAEVIAACTAHLAVGPRPEARALYTHYLAAAHHRLSQPARAIALWTQLLERDADSAFAGKAQLGLGLAYASLGDWPACEAACERYLAGARQGSDIIVAEYWHAEARAQQGEWQAAAAGFTAVLRRGGAHELALDARAALVECYARRGEVDEAWAAVEAFVRVAPGHAELGPSWLRVAQAMHNAGDAPRSVDAARLAVELDPALRLAASFVIADATLMRGDARTARSLLRGLLAEAATTAARARLRSGLAWAAFLDGDYTQATAFYQEAARFGWGALPPLDHLRLALSYRRLGAHAAAAAEFAQLQGEPALASSADDVHALLTEATLRTRTSLAALHLLQTGLGEWYESPHTAWRHERIAHIFRARGAWRETAEAYRAAARAADSPEASALLAWHAAYADARLGHWPRARRQLATVTTDLPAPHGPRPAALAGDLAAAGGRWAAAAAQYRRAARRASTPRESDALVVRAARAYAVAGDVPALSALSVETAATRHTAEVWLLLGAARAASGDGAGAQDAWSEAAAHGGRAGGHARLYLGWAALDAGDPAAALTYLSGVSLEAELTPWAQYGLALAHFGRRTYRVAAAEFANVARRYAALPLAEDAALRAGEALSGTGAWRETEQAYLAASQQVRTPEAKRAAMLGVGWTLAQRGFATDAAKAFAPALEGRNNDAAATQVYLWLGREAYAAGRYDEAGDRFAAAVQADPDPEALALGEYWLARSLWERGRYVAAAATFASCRRRPAAAPYEALVGYWEVRCADALEDSAAVLANVAGLRRTAPATRAWVALDMAAASAHRRRGEWAAALHAYDRVAAGDAGLAGAEATIAGAACLEALDDPDGAIVRLFRIRPGEHSPETVARARLELGRTLARVGRIPDARQMLVDIVRQYPDTDAARHATDELRALAAEPA